MPFGVLVWCPPLRETEIKGIGEIDLFSPVSCLPTRLKSRSQSAIPRRIIWTCVSLFEIVLFKLIDRFSEIGQSDVAAAGPVVGTGIARLCLNRLLIKFERICIPALNKVTMAKELDNERLALPVFQRLFEGTLQHH